MRRKRMQARPQMEALESMTLLSAAGAMMTGGRPLAVESMPPAPQPIVVSGTAVGSYVSQRSNPDTGTHYSLSAHGRITPIGRSVVSGSFTTPGFILNGKAQGTLTVAGPRGSITLKLVQITPPTSTSSTAATTQFDFRYTIVRGTGRFRHAEGAGTVTVALNTVHSGGSAGHLVSVGRTTITISATPVPMA